MLHVVSFYYFQWDLAQEMEQVCEAEKCLVWWGPGVNQHGSGRSFCMSVRTLEFMWSFSISLIRFSGLRFSDLELAKVEIVREKKPMIHIEILLAFYLLSCFSFSRSYLIYLLSKGHCCTCASEQWTAHKGHSTEVVGEGCSERLSLTPLYMANPIFSCICQCGTLVPSQHATG